MIRSTTALFVATLLAACGASDPAPRASPTITVAPAAAVGDPVRAARVERDYLGRWTGVEGMFVDVARAPGGGVVLDMQYDLDHRGTFPGSVTAEGIRFERDGEPLTLAPGDGAATGLKWLADKRDCLIVAPGEGYCRD